MGRVKSARLASRNAHKLEELRAALPGWELELLEAGEFPPEEGDSYYANARAKARFGRELAGFDAWVLGEDSGLEVEALGGGPGVRSARFAGEEHVDKLLAELEGIDDPRRQARYVCELVCISPGLEEFRGTGTLEGRIATEPRGDEGFGFDPIFIPVGESRTVAELGNAWKREQSHRARAARALVEALGEGPARPGPAPPHPAASGRARTTS
jgi:XTP/dITP diphosphohydrolase